MGNNQQKTKADRVILIIPILLVLFGIVMVFSATYYSEQAAGNTGQGFLQNQVLGAAIGLVLMFILSQVDYRIFSKSIITFAMILVSIVLLIIVYFTPELNNAHRWIDLGLFKFQPAEVARFAVIVLTARTLADYRNLETARSGEIKELFGGLLPYFIFLLIISLLIVFEPSLTMTIMLFGAVLCIFFAAGVKWRMLLLLGFVAALAVTALVFLKGWRVDRVKEFFAVWTDGIDHVGYQVKQSLYALGSGGLFGVGLGGSKQKLLYLTYGNSDFILSIIGEELGFIGVFILLALFIFLIIRCFAAAINCKNLFGSFLAVGIASTLAIQVMVNVAVVTASMPPTGVPLPFISSGNTSLVMFMAEIGIMLNISKQSRAGS